MQLQKKFSVLVADKELGTVPRAEPKLAEPSSNRTRGSQYTQTDKILFKHKKKVFHCEMLEQDAQKVCGVSVPGGISKCSCT